MKHEILYLSKKRAYVRVNDTWYDTIADFNPQIGQSFLTGRVDEVLSYEDYTAKYPESKDEIYPYISDKTMSGGYIRRGLDGLVRYGVNPETPSTSTKLETE
jgi:hypothetical protein